MPNPSELFPEDRRLQHPVYKGEIATAPANVAGSVYVRLGTWDETQLFGPCPWPTRTDQPLPEVGDTCWVTFDNEGDAVVLMWWPYAS